MRQTRRGFLSNILALIAAPWPVNRFWGSGSGKSVAPTFRPLPIGLADQILVVGNDGLHWYTLTDDMMAVLKRG